MTDASRPGATLVPDLAPDLGPLLRLGLLQAAPVAVAPSAPALLAEIEAACTRLAAEHAGLSPSEIPGLAPARSLYRALGIDPTHTRPSSEALLRRVLQGKGLYRILNAVDLANLCSLLFLLPIGLYDAGKIRGAVTLRRGRPGESYPGIRKDDVNLEGRPVLVDEDGPFGNPTSDSLRTSVTPATRALRMVLFAPVSFPVERLRVDLGTAADLMRRHLAPPDGAVEVAVGTVPG